MTSPTLRRRRGVILLVVLALLTLFAVVGLSFVFYAESVARSAQLAREAEGLDRPDVNPELLLSYFLGQVLYDQNDDAVGVSSALRGHSLARLLYGYDDRGPNFTPFNGTGRLHAPSPFAGVDDYSLVNYSYFPGDGFLRDPERLGWRTGLTAPRGPFTGGFNVSYTYPDLNNLFLAAIKADGTVLTPSYHRDWLFRHPSLPASVSALDRFNPHWQSPEGKYLTLRPRPVDMGSGFPYPEDAGGDVKNLIGGPGGNDSLWIDLGFPVLTAPDGRKYKSLFAPLIVDLDGRVNVNVHGNTRGRAGGKPAHASNQGWGRWEVNLQYVVSGQQGSTAEWPNLMFGTALPGQVGRYGGTPGQGQTHAGMLADSPGTAPHFYAPTDFDGCDELGGFAPSGRLQIPGQSNSSALPLSSFPAASGGYGNTSTDERTGHPLLYNVYDPATGGRAFAASNLEALLRAGDTGSPALTSDLLRLCPNSFADPRTRRLVTTHSFDLDKPGVSPWLYDLTASGYQGGTADQAPSGPPQAFPPVKQRLAPLLAQSDFAPDWRAVTAALGRLDLNRHLSPFPHQGSGNGVPFGPPLVGPADRFDASLDATSQFLEALAERQQFTNDLYHRLLTVTGVPTPAQPAAPTDAELMPRRWLAQLAANIVDFIDEDELSTPFNFYTEEDAYPNGRPAGAPPFDAGALSDADPELPRYWVFGTELPRVVVNEALAEYQLPANPATTPCYLTNIWVELHNPFPVAPPTTAQAVDSLAPLLRIPALPSGVPSTSRSGNARSFLSYQLVVADQLLARPANDNVLGKPNAIRTQSADASDADFNQPIQFLSGQQPNPAPSIAPQGFFLLGPKNPASDAHGVLASGGTVPGGTPILRLDNAMQYLVTYNPATGGWGPDDRANGLTVLLRRLANPHIPYDPNPTVRDGSGSIQANAWYNPYVTVDYLEKVPLQDAGTTGYASLGKTQPYAAHPSTTAAQQSGGVVQQTFGQPNQPVPPSGHYDWLVHFDRPLVSPMELLQVSGCQPHQLTRRFMTGNGPSQRFNHRVPWFDQSNRLYRLFEFVETHDLAAVQALGGRMPGKINLNTIWDQETLLALCDPQPSNDFTRDDVVALFGRLLRSRTPAGQPGPNDRPVQGLAAGVTPPDDPQHPNQGIDDTLLRADPDDPTKRLFEITPGGVPAHPYVGAELLTKLCNNVTTRSNVFAVWVTVGFFEVTDDTARPVRLGAEIGRAENRQRRHRLFAIVDRSTIPANARPVPRFDPRADAAVTYFSIID
jgi:hypothetical protein